MRKTKILIAIIVIMAAMLIAQKGVKASDDTDLDYWKNQYQLVNVGENNYRLFFNKDYLKSGHDYYVWVDKKDDISNSFFGEIYVGQNLTAEFVNSVQSTKISESGMTVDVLQDKEGNEITSAQELINDYCFFIFEEYQDGETNIVTMSLKFDFKNILNSPNWKDFKYDIVRKLGRGTEGVNYWDEEYYEYVMSKISLNPDHKYYIWIDKNNGKFFNTNENFIITAKFINDVRLNVISNNGKAEIIGENTSAKSLEDLIKNYSFQIIEEEKEGDFEFAKVVVDKTAFEKSTSVQKWINTNNFKYELDGTDGNGCSLKFSGLELNKEHNYYVWIYKNGVDYAIPESVNLDFPIYDYASLYELDNKSMSTSKILNSDGIAMNPEAIYDNYAFQIIEEYIPYQCNVAISRVIVNSTLIEEVKEQTPEDVANPDKDKEKPAPEDVADPDKDKEKPTPEDVADPDKDKEEVKHTYKVIEGANQVYSNKDLTIKFDAPAEDLVELLINGEKVDSDYYIVKSGSTIITVKDSYLKTLTSGIYTLTAKYKDGQIAETSFAVEKVQDNTQAEENLPQAGLFSIAMVTAIVVSVGVVYISYKKQKSIVIK